MAGEAAAVALAPRRRTAAPRERIEHLRALYAQTPASLVGNAVGWALIGLIFWPLADRPVLVGWMAALAILWLLRLAHHLRYRRRRDADDMLLRSWQPSWIALVLAQGGLWGLAAWLFWGLDDGYPRVALLLVVYSYCLASVQLLASQPTVFLAFIGLVQLPAVLRVASDDSQPWHAALAAVLVLQFLVAVVMGRTHRSALDQAVRMKARADELAAQLRLEVEATEQARRAAEAASRAKTQFFAAASHDLRQPLHAMGLFVEALRQRSDDAQTTALVGSLGESVDALEELFAELLDITRIDSGGIEVRPAAVPIGDLFTRLRLHFEPIAFDKGLSLVFRGGHHAVQADPLLLERVLRNLLANAIRYTDDGGVLVACRPRRGGTRLRLQVCDSGIGIDAAELPHIFDEFYQVQRAPRAGAERRKGLGLGLAIVARLAALMGSRVDVRSRPGHGSMFWLELPAATSPSAPPPQAAARPSLTLNGRRIVVVEDEPAVRHGLSLLLQGWGATVQAFDGLAPLRGWCGAAGAEVPDLLIVDHRLSDGGTGLQAIGLLRARFGRPALPAIVVSGSDPTGTDADAARHDFHLLLKPVPPARLRALIGFKLGLR